MDHLHPKNANDLLEIEKPKNNVLAEFIQSSVYSGIVSPIRGVAQIVDHTSGSKTDKTVQNGFEALGVKAPEHAEFGTATWYAQQLGNAAGMAVPFMLTRSAMQAGTAKVFGEAAIYKSALDIGATHTLKQFAVHEAATSAAAGLLYGTLLTPSQEKNVGDIAFVGDRLKAAAANIAVFGTLGFTAPYMSKGLSSAAAALEQTTVSNIAKTPLAATLQGPVLAGALSGLPAGLVSAELAAISDNRLVPTGGELKEHLVGMAFVGGAFATKQWLSSQREGTNVTNGRHLTDKIGLTEAANNRKADFHLLEGQAELARLQRSIASGADRAQAQVVVRPELETVGSALLGKQFTTLGDSRTMLLDHRSAGVIAAGSIKNVNLLATCCNLEPALVRHDVFPTRNSYGKDGTVWLQSNPERPGKFTLSLDSRIQDLQTNRSGSDARSHSQKLVEVPLGNPPEATPPAVNVAEVKNPAMRAGDGQFSVLGKTLARPGDSTTLAFLKDGTRSSLLNYDTIARIGIGADSLPFAKVEIGPGLWAHNGSPMEIKRAYTLSIGDTLSMNQKVNFKVEANPASRETNALRLVQGNANEGPFKPLTGALNDTPAAPVNRDLPAKAPNDRSPAPADRTASPAPKPWTGSPELRFHVGEKLPPAQIENMLAVSDGKYRPRPRSSYDNSGKYDIDPVMVHKAYGRTGERFSYDETGKILSRSEPISQKTEGNKVTYTYDNQTTATWHSDKSLVITERHGTGQEYSRTLRKNADGSGTIEYASGLTRTLRTDGSILEHHPTEGWTKETRLAPKYFGREVITTTDKNGVKFTEFENSLGTERIKELPNGSKERTFSGRIAEFPKELPASEMKPLKQGKTLDTALADSQVSLTHDGKLIVARSNSQKVFELGMNVNKAAIVVAPESNALSIYATTAKGEKLQVILTEYDRVAKINRSAAEGSMVELHRDPLSSSNVEKTEPIFDGGRDRPRPVPTEKLSDSLLKEGYRLNHSEFGRYDFNTIALKDGRVINFNNNGMILGTIKPDSTAKVGNAQVYTYGHGPTQKSVLSWEGDTLTVNGRMGGRDSQITKDAVGQSIETYGKNEITYRHDNSSKIVRGDGIVITDTPGSFTQGKEFTATRWPNGKLLIEQKHPDGYTRDTITHHPNRSGTEIQFSGKAGAIEITGTGEIRVLLPAKPETSHSSGGRPRYAPDPAPSPRMSLTPRMF